MSEKVTFAADAFFDVNKSALKPEGKAKLDDLVSKVKGINLEVIIAVGHTDSVGADTYNQKLSVRRAEAVKAYEELEELAFETDLLEFEDLFDGSHVVGAKTEALKDQARAMLAKLDATGGAIAITSN